MNFLGMGPAELLLVLVLALIVFGPDKLPDIARQLGRTVAELRRVSSDVTREIQRSIQDEAPSSGPRIVRQSPITPPPGPAPLSPSAASIPQPEPTILPPSYGGTLTAPPGEPANAPTNSGPTTPSAPVQGSWEEGPVQPAIPDRGQEPRRRA
jgi:sec-independent protein translocase protein TatA